MLAEQDVCKLLYFFVRVDPRELDQLALGGPKVREVVVADADEALGDARPAARAAEVHVVFASRRVPDSFLPRTKRQG